MITVIVGKTASGKTTIVDRLVSLHDFSKIITYTSRPIRKGEKQDVDYHFISEEYFKHLIDNDFFAEWKSYDTTEGTWYYGTALEDLENNTDNSVIILTPDGYRDVCKKLAKKPMCIYIYANNSTIKKRLVLRGDNENEANRRLAHDNADFKGFEYETDKIIYNNEGTNIDDVVNKVLEFIEEK